MEHRIQVPSVSFRATGWLVELSTFHCDFESRHRQTLWEANHALYLSIEQRDRDPELKQL